MTTYIILFFAILAEILATSALKLSEGFSKLIPSIVVICGYCLAFWLMSITLKALPVGIVYAIWSGFGIIGIAIIGVLFFKEAFTLWHFLGISLIIAGVIILSLISKNH